MRLLILILSVILNTYVFSQNENDSIMYWDKDTKLNWSDFKGKIVDTSDYKVAVSYIEINTHAFWEDGMPNYKIVAIFKKPDSWSKDTSNYGLIHEQKHFDIGELFARKMRKAIFELRKKGIVNTSDYLKALNSLFDEYLNFQNIYDIETANGVYKDEQVEWNEKIAKELNYLNEYAVDYEEYLK